MPRIKETNKTRSKPHKAHTAKLRKRKNKLKAKRRAARSRPHRSSSRKK
jgi:hypothetical protein